MLLRGDSRHYVQHHPHERPIRGSFGDLDLLQNRIEFARSMALPFNSATFVRFEQ